MFTSSPTFVADHREWERGAAERGVPAGRTSSLYLQDQTRTSEANITGAASRCLADGPPRVKDRGRCYCNCAFRWEAERERAREREKRRKTFNPLHPRHTSEVLCLQVCSLALSLSLRFIIRSNRIVSSPVRYRWPFSLLLIVVSIQRRIFKTFLLRPKKQHICFVFFQHVGKSTNCPFFWSILT